MSAEPQGSLEPFPLVSERERSEPLMSTNETGGADIELLLRRIIREEAGLTPVAPADKWRGGDMILRPGKPGLQERVWPIETFFHKVVMIRNRLRVLEQQSVESISADYSDHRDPNLFGIRATLKEEGPRTAVNTAIEAAVAEVVAGKVDAKRVADIKDNLKYGVAMALETHTAVAEELAVTSGILGSPEAFENRLKAITVIKPADLAAFAKKHLIEKNRTTLVFDVDVPKGAAK